MQPKEMPDRLRSILGNLRDLKKLYLYDDSNQMLDNNINWLENYLDKKTREREKLILTRIENLKAKLAKNPRHFSSKVALKRWEAKLKANLG